VGRCLPAVHSATLEFTAPQNSTEADGQIGFPVAASPAALFGADGVVRKPERRAVGTPVNETLAIKGIVMTKLMPWIIVLWALPGGALHAQPVDIEKTMARFLTAFANRERASFQCVFGR
jgi:hypothetical protein